MFDVDVTPEQSQSIKTAVAEVLPLVAHHESRYPSVFLDSGLVIAASPKAHIEKPHELPLPARIALPRIEATILSETRSDIVQIVGFIDHYEFVFADGSKLTVPPQETLTYTDYPKQGRLESVLLACNLYTPVTDSFKEKAAKALKASGNKGQVIIGRGRIRAFNRHHAEVGTNEFDDPGHAFDVPIKLDADQLAMALPHMTAATVWGDGRGMSFTNGGLRGSLMGARA